MNKLKSTSYFLILVLMAFSHPLNNIGDESYQLLVPSSLRVVQIEDGNFAATYESGAKQKKNDYKVEVYEDLSLPCTSATLGVYQPTTSLDQSTKWGEVDHNFSIYTEDQNPVCLPPSVTEYDKENKYNGTTAFALCSEHQNKRVFICIAQQTPNPTLAKQIFESFRWLEPTDIFVDVPITHPNATAIAYVKQQGIVQGYDDSTFKSNNTINRAEFTKIIMGATTMSSRVESATADEVSRDDNSACFSDVPSTAWFSPYVCSAKEQGIINGYPDATFKPANTINAAEMYKIVANAFKLPVQQSIAATWYTPYEYALQSIDAIPASITSADHLVTRGEMAEVVYRVMEAQR